MKRIAILGALLSSIVTAFAATEPENAEARIVTIVKGQVVDAETLLGEPYSTYKIWKGSRTQNPVIMTITDEDGRFSEELKGRGEFTILITSLGRKDIERTFTVEGTEGTIDLGVLPFENDIETLASSTVVALRPLVKMEVDKMTYAVEDDVDSKSSTVLDMLRKVPMVTVDGQDNITVNGSSSFQVLIDGKPNAMISGNASTVFKSMPASYVKSIEVITNPGVKYDAEGVGGVLNITTVRASGGGSAVNMDGYNATVGVMASNRGGGVRGFVSAQKGKFSVSANLNAMRMSSPGTESETIREQLDASGNVLSTLESTSAMTLKTPANMASINVGYEIDTLRLVSASFGLMNFASNTLGDMSTTLTPAGLPSLGYTGTSESDWDSNSITGGLDYQRVWADNKARTLTLSYQFSSSPSNTDSKTLFDTATWPGTLQNRFTDGSTNSVNHTFQADFTTPLAEGLTMNFGSKYINRNNTSSQKLYLDDVYDANGSMEYTHLNNIVAGYGELSLNREKWGAKAGARYEHTFQDVKYALGNGTDFSLDYGNFVPSASLQYNLSMLSNIGLSYNMRISRPGITYLNPYVDISDPTARSYGNTLLETEKAHNVNLVYNFYSPVLMVNATLRHTYSPNSISAYSFYDDGGLLNTTYGNIVSSNTTGFNTFVNLNLGNKTRIMANASVNYTDLRSGQLSQQNYGWSSTIFGGVQQTLPLDIRLSANVMYSSPMVSLQGRSDGISLAMGGLTKTFLGDKLSVGLNGVVPLAKGGRLIRKDVTSGADYRNTSVVTVPMSRIMLNVSYTFGNSKITTAKKAKKTISNDDLMDRSNGAEQMNSYGM